MSSACVSGATGAVIGAATQTDLLDQASSSSSSVSHTTEQRAQRRLVELDGDDIVSHTNADTAADDDHAIQTVLASQLYEDNSSLAPPARKCISEPPKPLPDSGVSVVGSSIDGPGSVQCVTAYNNNNSLYHPQGSAGAGTHSNSSFTRSKSARCYNHPLQSSIVYQNCEYPPTLDMKGNQKGTIPVARIKEGSQLIKNLRRTHTIAEMNNVRHNYYSHNRRGQPNLFNSQFPPIHRRTRLAPRLQKMAPLPKRTEQQPFSFNMKSADLIARANSISTKNTEILVPSGGAHNGAMGAMESFQSSNASLFVPKRHYKLAVQRVPMQMKQVEMNDEPDKKQATSSSHKMTRVSNNYAKVINRNHRELFAEDEGYQNDNGAGASYYHDDMYTPQFESPSPRNYPVSPRLNGSAKDNGSSGREVAAKPLQPHPPLEQKPGRADKKPETAEKSRSAKQHGQKTVIKFYTGRDDEVDERQLRLSAGGANKALKKSSFNAKLSQKNSSNHTNTSSWSQLQIASEAAKQRKLPVHRSMDAAVFRPTVYNLLPSHTYIPQLNKPGTTSATASPVTLTQKNLKIHEDLSAVGSESNIEEIVLSSETVVKRELDSPPLVSDRTLNWIKSRQIVDEVPLPPNTPNIERIMEEPDHEVTVGER